MDSMLRQEISRAIRHSPYLFGATLLWNAEQGRVILKGTVPTWFLKQMIQETIRPIKGVSEIQNEVLVVNENYYCKNGNNI